QCQSTCIPSTYHDTLTDRCHVMLECHHQRPSHRFFFTDTAPTYIYPLSLHDALPILRAFHRPSARLLSPRPSVGLAIAHRRALRSEEHTSELQSRFDLVCRLLLEKKNR